MIPARGPQTMFLCNICCAGTQTATSNPGIQAIGSWARYLGLGTQA